MVFSNQEYCSGLLFPPPRDLPNPGIEPTSPAFPVLAGRFFTLDILEILAVASDAVKLLQSCPTLCNPIDGSPPGSPIPGILQARLLEWGAIAFSNA